jgi:hypothetical protein
MTVRGGRLIHYVGTDPNHDNWITELGISRYEYLADFINRAIEPYAGGTHTCEIFDRGSEVIGDDPLFQRYKGTIDLCLTSPPYWCKEQYSDDPGQSYLKFKTYSEWRDGFLRPTLETAYGYLRPNRYLLWNIAKVTIGGEEIPLEDDSINIVKNELGGSYLGHEKLELASMAGGNRIGEDGVPTCSNCGRRDGKWLKYEPVMVFRKDARAFVAGVDLAAGEPTAVERSCGLRQAVPSEADEIYSAFRKRADIFPFMRKDKIQGRIARGQCIFDDGVIITYQRYKKPTRVGSVQIPHGSIMLHQILNSKQFSGAGRSIFEKFFNQIVVPSGGDLYLSVREENTVARAFYERHGMSVVGSVTWKNGSLPGTVYRKRVAASATISSPSAA